MEIALISCAKLKQTHPCQAQEMYLPSVLFRKASAYIKKSNYDAWFILSAKYGLLKPHLIIEPYNVTLNKMAKKDILIWSEKVYNQLLSYSIESIDFFAGKKYRLYLLPKLEKDGITCRIPLEGLGIGQQLQYYKRSI